METEPAADGPLAAALAADLDAAFERLVLVHQDRLFTIAFRTGGNRHDAEELVQDCFVRAYRALASYPPARIRELRLRGWLTTILLNAGRNRARVKRVPTTELVFDPGAEPGRLVLIHRRARVTDQRAQSETARQHPCSVDAPVESDALPLRSLRGRAPDRHGWRGSWLGRLKASAVTG